MTTNWKRIETADGAGAEAPRAGRASSPAVRRPVRELRWKQDAVCGYAEADEVLRDAEADSEGSSLTRTIFFSSRIQSQPTTRKEPFNTTQEKKGKNKQQKQVTIRKKLETLA